MTDSLALSARNDLHTAIPQQPSRLPPSESSRGPVILTADPGDADGEVFISQVTGFRIVSARTIGEVHRIISTGTIGPLAMVSLRFNGSTRPVIQSLKRAGWQRILALTFADTPVVAVVDAINAGASGVLTVAGVMERQTAPGHPAHTLSPREVEVVRLVAEGLTNNAIGQRLSLSGMTVKNHLARISRKLHAGDRAHIVAIAYRGRGISRSALESPAPQ